MMSEWEFLDDFEDVKPVPRDDIEVQAFIAKCHEDIYDIGPMLVFADWLEEREYCKSARRLRLVAEYYLIYTKPHFAFPFAATALNDTFDIELDYMFALNEKWLAHKPQHMDWKPRVIKSPECITPLGQRQPSVEYNPLHVSMVVINRNYKNRPETSYTYGYTNYGREWFGEGSDNMCTVLKQMNYDMFAQWLKCRREKILVGNSNIVGFAVQMTLPAQGGFSFRFGPGSTDQQPDWGGIINTITTNT